MGRYANGVAESKREKAEEMLEAGCSRGQIVRDLNVSLTTLRKWFGRTKTIVQHNAEMKALCAEMRKNHATYSGITRATGVSSSTLTKWFGPSLAEEALWHANEERSRVAREKYEKAVRLRMREGLTNAQIAERVGLSHSRVYAQLGPTPARLGGIRPHDPGLHDRARYLRSCDYTISQISEEMGINRSTIHDWVREMPCGQ